MHLNKFFTTHQALAGSALLLACTAVFGQAPDTFTWTGGTGNWEDTMKWSSLLNDHPLPGIAGDAVVINGAASIILASDIELGTITAGSLQAPAAEIKAGVTPATLSFNTPLAQNNVSITRDYATMTFGVLDSDLLTLQLQKPTAFYRAGGSYGGRFNLHAKITGGTEAAPCHLIFYSNNNRWAYYRAVLSNINNTFRGDIYIGNAIAEEQTKLTVGWNNNGHNAMLGHPDNKIIMAMLHGSEALVFWNSNGVLDRHISGYGRVIGAAASGDNSDVAQALNLGPNTVLAPSKNESVGAMTIQGTTIALDPAATASLFLTKTSCSTLRVVATKPFAWQSRILLDPIQSQIPANTEWTIMTIDKSATSFTFTPSFVSDGYACTVTGDATTGWEVVARKITADPDVCVENIAASIIDASQANVAAHVLELPPASEATLRVYYGTTDEKFSPSAWSHCFEYPNPVTQTGIQSPVTLTGLNVNTTYYYRHSISNATGEQIATNVKSFTTVPFETPNTFTWIATNDNWFAENVWRPNLPNARQYPGLPGDNIIINVGGVYQTIGVTRTITLTQDVSVASIDITQGYGAAAIFEATQPATMTLDAGHVYNPSSTIQSTGQLGTLNIGNSASSQLTLALNNPLTLYRTSSWDLTIGVYAKLTGGTDAQPFNIYLDVNGNSYVKAFLRLLNPANTFRGDIYIGRTSDVAGPAEVMVGVSGIIATDSMLGHSNNKIHLRNNSTLNYNAASATAMISVERHILGNGTLKTNGKFALSPTAILQPHAKTSEDGFGTITVSATSFSDDPGTQYLIKVPDTEGANDKLVFNITGDIAVNGKLVFTPTVQKIPLGLTWDVMTINKPAAATFTHSLKGSNGFAVTVDASDPAKIIVRATSIAYSTLLMVR